MMALALVVIALADWRQAWATEMKATAKSVFHAGMFFNGS
jgi:hypothetical protein